MIDAPVSGGTAGAQAATLTFMVGGESGAIECARPLLEKMGKNILHAGANGAGQTVKVCNNMLVGIQMLGTSEALRLKWLGSSGAVGDHVQKFWPKLGS